MRCVDTRKREKEILHLVVESYIEETTPISSGYLCRRYSLPCSSATVRSIMESLERKGFLSHVHTSSGRVPTTAGFKKYVADLKEEERLDEVSPENKEEDAVCYDRGSSLDDFFRSALDDLAEESGYTSLVAFDDKLFFRGTRFMLEQPEFEDMRRLKSLLYALEVKMQVLQHLLSHSLEGVSILIGEDIGCDEIAECSLVISGLHSDDWVGGLALLGPMRMDYIKAVSSLYSARHRLEDCLRRSIEE